MALKGWFKGKQETEAAAQEIRDPLVHQLALRIRGTFDLDDILQLAINAVGEQLKVDHCLAYLCDPNVDTLRWRAGYQRAELTPLRWPLRESDFLELFARLRKAEIVRISDPLHDSLVASSRDRFEAAGVRSLVFAPAFGDQLEAVLILGMNQPRQWSEEELQLLETVTAEIAIAARHMALSSALRRAGSQVYTATAELQTENQHLQGLVQLLLLPSADLAQVLNHITESLASLYGVKVCSIEEVQGQVANVRSMRLADRMTNLGVFTIDGTPRQPVMETTQHRVILNAMEAYPEDQFLKENNLNFYAGVPIVNRAGELIGLLNLYNAEAVNFQKRDLKTLAALARRIGFELEEERSHRARQEAEFEIQWRLEAATQWEEQVKFLQEARELLRQATSLEAGLQELVVTANERMGSDFAAIAVYDENKQFKHLFTAGLDSTVRQAIGDLPTGRGLLGVLANWNGPLRLDTLMSHPRFTGFPANHPVMRSFLAAPLRVRGETVGAIYFADKNGGQSFSNEDELFATDLAAQIAVAVAAPVVTVSSPPLRADAGEQEKERVGERESGRAGDAQPAASSLSHSPMPSAPTPWPLFSDLFALIERGTSIEQISTSLVEALMEFFPGSAAALWLLEPSTHSLAPVAGRGAPVERLAQRGPIRLGEGVVGRAAISGQTLAISDLSQSSDAPDELKSLVSPDEHFTSATFVPLKTGDKTLGLMVIFGADSHPTEQDIRAFLEVIAYCLGRFVEQSRMAEAVSHHSQEMAQMQTMIESLGEPSTLEHLCDQVLDHLTDSLNASHAALFLYQSDERAFVLFRYRGVDKILASLAERIPLANAEDSISTLTTGEPLIISELETDPNIKSKDLLEVLQAEGLRSGVVVPLQTGDGLMGLLALGSPEPNHFSHYSGQFFSILTGRIADTVAQVAKPAPSETPLAQSLSQGKGNGAARLTETLLKNLNSGVVAVDREGRITIFNPAMERLTGYRRHEALGQSISADGLALFAHGNPFAEVLTHAQVVSRQETQVLIRGGAKKYVSMTITPLTDEPGTVVGAVGLFTDITEIRALEHERYRLTPLALIGEMSARLAHEIKNPLASMMSGLELLKRRLHYGEREGHYFERLIAELQRLDTTVREMLAFSRTTPPRLTQVDPADPLERALDTLMPQLEAGRIAVRRDYQPQLEPTLLDANQMEQVFLNLIINAVQAMPDGGMLHVSVQARSAQGEDDTETAIIEYVVRDTGVGIPADVIDKIFDPFFSTKTHGTGLGLASVQKIIEVHQGQISVQSQPGEGATFTIRLKQNPSEQPVTMET